MSIIPRPEHPRPQFERAGWLNLNGEWQFETDNGRSGIERKLYENSVTLEKTIIVPFCPESRLSGVEYKDFMYGVWYKRSVTLTAEQVSGRTVLHFGAVDYKCTVFVNEKKVGTHKGGYSSFCFDVTGYVTAGENTVAVFAEDDTRDPMIPRGKQSELYYSHACDYTRTTGIWQTVWLEFTPKEYIKSVKYYPNIHNSSVVIDADVCGKGTFTAEVFYEGRPVGSESVGLSGGRTSVTVKLSETHLWEVGAGRLYDVVLSFGEDTVKSYFGLRTVRLDGFKFLINEKSVFQRLVLDQGFYPDGIYTAPSDEALKNDIKLSMDMGFNGARLHQKVFEERFLYHCDKAGYIVWGEYADWGLNVSYPESIYEFLPEWSSVVERDFNHPAIIGWCPHNETWYINFRDRRNQWNDGIKLTYNVTKLIDKTRPCIDTSGGFHVETDIYDVHTYEQNPVRFREMFEPLLTESRLFEPFPRFEQYCGEPTFVSEYGGIRWSDDKSGWGYGEGPKTEQEFLDRFKGLTDVLLDNPKMFGLCYTQLTDVEQEQNGLYTYDRRPKFDAGFISGVLKRKAAIED